MISRSTELPNITSRGQFPDVKKSHKAVIGALLLSDQSLRPYAYGGKTYWTVDFLAPSGPMWDVRTHPLILTEDKVLKMVEESLLAIVSDDEVALTRYGAIVAEGSECDWHAYWDVHYYNYKMPNNRPLDWVHYFKTGTMRSI